jgi:phosphonoacetaldehyde hydrolase
MEFAYQRSYRGPIKLVVFDWAGTTIDHGCHAPAVVFTEVFRRYGVEITVEQARAPMGLKKIDHIRAIAQMPAVAEEWERVRGHPPTEEDVVEMAEEHFYPLQLACIADYCDLIPGTLKTVAALRARGIRIGSTTGYFREALEVCVREGKKRDYAPDAAVCASDVPAGRPAPWMLYRNMEELGIYPPEAVIKVGDTKPDVTAGLNAGVWTVAVAKTGNEVGLTEAQLAALSPDEVAKKVEAASQGLAGAGAHYVVESIADLLPLVDRIEDRLRAGERP